MKTRSFTLVYILVIFAMLAGCAQVNTQTAVPSQGEQQQPAVAATQASNEAPTEATTAPENPPAAPAEEKVLTIAQQSDAFSMDPTQHTQKPTGSILFQIYDPLVIMQPDGTIAPGLATSWEQTNQLHWIFNLRDGVKFTNGEPMNADAVVYSINRAIDPETNSPYLSRVNNIVAAEKVDDLTVQITTKEPDPILLSRLHQMSFPMLIVPPEYTEANGGIIPDDAPVGTGPYKFVEWVKDDHVTLEANPDYWGGKPAFNKVIFKPIPETSARISALKNNEVDIAANIPPELVESIESNPGTTTVEVASDYLYFIGINTETVDAFKDVRVRQALNYAVDKDAILENIMLGHGVPIAVTMTQNGFGYPDGLEPYPYDPEKAKALLADAGYPDGFGPVVFMSRNGRYVKDAEIVQAVAQYLNEVGVKTEIQFVESGVWGDLGNSHARGDINFPGWSGMDPDLVWYPILHCGEFQSYYCNPDLDKLLEEGRNTIDQAKREEVYQQAGEIIFEDAPHIPLMQPTLIFGINDALSWQPNPADIIDLRGASLE